MVLEIFSLEGNLMTLVVLGSDRSSRKCVTKILCLVVVLLSKSFSMSGEDEWTMSSSQKEVRPAEPSIGTICTSHKLGNLQVQSDNLIHFLKGHLRPLSVVSFKIVLN